MKPISFPTSASLKMDKKQAKQFQNWLHPLHRPRHISPKRRVKWRLVKKWFNRYEKPDLLGRTILIQYRTGLSGLSELTDVKIEKAGKHRRTYCISCKPITDCKEL